MFLPSVPLDERNGNVNKDGARFSAVAVNIFK